MLNRAIEVAAAAGCQHVRCHADWKSPAEIALYLKCGFAMTDITDGEEGGDYFAVRPL
ncbi:MAG: hypothetical protein NTV86_22420 [Planctomycetota bacterium]|nr:hypothetical protein [Planctomycetota bacterium]